MISVIIPYFQKTPGILAKSLASIAAQKSCPYDLSVIVVDDASPAPVGPKLKEVGALAFQVRTIQQANSGPAVVYAYERFKHARFNTKFTAAGEDCLFWMDLVKQGAKIAFSSIPDVRCGHGVNIYSGAKMGKSSIFITNPP